MDVSDKDTAELVADRQVEDIPDVIPLLPIRDIVIFPYMMIPLFVGREISINAVNEALARDRHIFLVVQKDATEDEPDADDLHRVGTVATILRMLKLDDGRVKILVQGLTKGAVEAVLQEKPFFEARIEKVVEQQVIELSIEVEALMRNVKEKIEQILNLKNLPPEIVMVTDNVVDPGVRSRTWWLPTCASRSRRASRSWRSTSRWTGSRKSTSCSPASSSSPPCRTASRTRPRTR